MHVRTLLFSIALLLANIGFGEEMQPLPMQDVQLNHIYLVVDRKTYESIKNSDFIHSLVCTYEQKNSADGEVEWEGFYMRGKKTFIELFCPQERYPAIGIAGIGLGVDVRGALDLLLEKVPHFKKGTFSREGKPWFSFLTVEDIYFYEHNACWVMEYAPEYFPEEPADVSRVRYNADRYDPNKPFLDIDGFSIALKPEGLELLSSCLNNFGLKAADGSYETSEKIEIRLSEESCEQKGIYQIDFSLRDACLDGYSGRLGNSLLTIRGDRASWIFFGQ